MSVLLDQRRELEQKIDTIQGETATRVAELEAKLIDLTNQNETLTTELRTTATKLDSLKQTHAKCADQRNKIDKMKENQLPSSNLCTQKRNAVPTKDEDTATPVGKKQRVDFVETETQIVLDPFKLIEETKFQLSRLGLSAKHLAEKLKVNRSHVSYILAHPVPWEELSEAIKDHYRNIYSWLVELENKERKENPKAVVKKQRLDFAKTETKIVLDPFELAEKIKFQLSRLGLSAKHVAEKLQVGNRYVSKILMHPSPWVELSEVWKDHYRKMHDWLLEHKTKERENPVSSRNLVVSEWLNTTEEAREILTLLDINGISRLFFANRKLNLNICEFEELVADPLPWNCLSDEEKKTFTLIHMWRNAKPAELEELKRSFERYTNAERDRKKSYFNRLN
jgi:transcriptional regulator with XRE-family HTH domain